MCSPSRFGKRISIALISLLTACLTFQCNTSEAPLSIQKENRIVLLGNNLASRMIHFGHFETELQLRFADSMIVIRNMGDGGNTPGFRPHPGRPDPWAFPGADSFQTELAIPSGSQGHFETPDQWLTSLETDIILAFFGFNESYEGEAGFAAFQAELTAFVKHTLTQKYNGASAPKLALISPTAIEDLSHMYDLPDGSETNRRLAAYTAAMHEIARKHNITFVDLFTASRSWYAESESPLTIDGLQLNDIGYRQLAGFLADELFGAGNSARENRREAVHEAVMEKNWVWHNEFKIPNGVHVYGRRYEPFGPDNYPEELLKIREMIAIRDSAIWLATRGEKMDLAAADARTRPLPAVESNYKPTYGTGDKQYLYGQDALNRFRMATGYKIELFASEREFEDLANPVQLSFDNAGRLWIATMPAYPHWKPGDPKPDDKLIILEDTDGDGKADKQTTWADGLHLPLGFEFAPEGVYVSQGTDLVLLTDTDGDDKADRKEVVLSGFDDHDTHHAISAFVTDPSGALYMAEGVFLHTNVETPYGPVRATNGGFFRYSPQRKHLERTAQLAIPNPWGIAFDEWGQNFFAETSGPDVRWMMPGSVKPRYGVATHKSFNIIEDAHRVRPTSGLEFVSSRHFPDEVQGDLLINNAIGFLGTKQHQMFDDGTGYYSKHRHDLLVSDDANFRPVDMEFAPDGSLYLVDWHNVLIGHMQHNARDPLRDHAHGRIYRITYPARPLVEPAQVAGASIETLLDNLKLPEYRTRYRTRRELRARNADEVMVALGKWWQALDEGSPDFEKHSLEVLWVTWALNRIDKSLLETLLSAKDYRIRAAAVRVLRYAGHQIKDQAALLKQAAADDHGRVRLEAIVAASWLNKDDGVAIVAEAGKKQLDKWMMPPHLTSLAHLHGESVRSKTAEEVETDLTGEALAQFKNGREIYHRDGFCNTCHQPDGKGLKGAGFPPISETKWVNGNEERLIKLTLNGLYGPIEVKGETYPGQVPMTPFRGLLNDEEVAAVLTFVRNSFGNKAAPITAARVKAVREATSGKKDLYTVEELLKAHPLQ